MNIEKINIEKLKPAKYNPRKDLKPEDEEYQKIKKSITEFGYVEPIIVNADMTVIGGHQRLKVLKELGYNEIECVIVDVDKETEKKLNIALNNITGEWDDDKLKELLYELQQAGADMEATGFSTDDIDNMLKDMLDSKEDDFDIEEALNEIDEPVTKKGDIWLLGKNRLMCGDSTQKDEVLHLLNGQTADMCLTDPPYNVNYEGKTDEGLTIENDNLQDEEFYKFLEEAFKNLYESTKEGGSIYVFHADTEGLNFRNAFKNAGFKLAQCLIWVKNSFVLGRQDYQWQHEPILYGWKEGKKHYFVDNRTKSTILEYDKPLKSEEHPTMKPIELLVELIKNSSREDDLILDLFGGSGSTMIATEQMNRKCYMMELDTKYCDVIIKRWENLTGEKAVLLEE